MLYFQVNCLKYLYVVQLYCLLLVYSSTKRCNCETWQTIWKFLTILWRGYYIQSTAYICHYCDIVSSFLFKNYFNINYLWHYINVTGMSKSTNVQWNVNSKQSNLKNRVQINEVSLYYISHDCNYHYSHHSLSLSHP